MLGQVLLCITAASVPAVTKDAADRAAVAVPKGTGRTVPERNRFGTRDNFWGAENSRSLGGCRSHPGLLYSVNILQGWGGFRAAFASEWRGA